MTEKVLFKTELLWQFMNKKLRFVIWETEVNLTAPTKEAAMLVTREKRAGQSWKCKRQGSQAATVTEECSLL